MRHPAQAWFFPLVATLCTACHPSSNGGSEPGAPGGWGMQPQWPAELLGPHGVELSAASHSDGVWLVAGTAHGSLSVAERSLFETAGAFVVGLRDSGAPAWVRVLESESDVRIEALAPMPSGGALLVGSFAGDVRSGTFELKPAGGRDCMAGRVDGNGGIVWLRSFGGSGDDACNAVAVADDGNAWLVGDLTAPWAEGITAQVEGAADVFVASIGLTDGRLGPARVFGSAGDDHGRGVALAPDGGMMVVGSFGGRANPPKPAAAPLRLPLREGLELSPQGDADGFAVRLDSAGVARFAVPLSSPGFDLARGVIWDAEGWIVTGALQPGMTQEGASGLASSAPLEAIVVSIDDEGASRWQWSDPSAGVVASAVTDPTGVYVVASSTGSLRTESRAAGVAGLTRAVVVRLGNDGTPSVVADCDGPGPDLPGALATDGRAIMLAYNGTGPSACVDSSVRGGFVVEVAKSPDSDG